MKANLAQFADKVMDLLVDTVCAVDEAGRCAYLSASCEALLGYKPEELIGKPIIDFVHPDDREKTLAAAARVMQGKPHAHFENRYIRKDGHIVEIMWSARWSEKERLRLAVGRDVTALKRAARRQEAIYKISQASQSSKGLPALFSNVHEFIGSLLPVDRFYVAQYFATHHGRLAFPYFFDGRERNQAPQPLRAQTLIARVLLEGKAVLANSTGSQCPVTAQDTGRSDYDWIGVPLSSSAGITGAIVIQVRDGDFSYCEEDLDLMQFVGTQISSAIERKRQEARLHHMAHHDALTNLPNRALFNDRMRVALSGARRSGERLVLFYLDLCDFKMVNDSLGHAAGDEVLREVARRLKGCIRESDTVCRIGGDEFTVLVNGVKNDSTVNVIARKVQAAVAAPVELEGRKFSLNVDVGMATFPDDGDTAEELLHHADTNMYSAKRKRATKAPCYEDVVYGS